MRKSISKNFELKYNLDYSDDEIIITAGVQESIALAMISLLKADDEVLITSPRFTTYDLTVRMCNAKPVPVHTYEKDNFALMPELIEQKIVTGGMLPKTECCIRSLAQGVVAAHIIDGRISHALLLEIFTDAGIGTMITGRG